MPAPRRAGSGAANLCGKNSAFSGKSTVTMKQQTIGFIGGGNMARCLAGGLRNNGWDPQRLLVADPDQGVRNSLTNSLGVRVSESNVDVAAAADALVLAVKPQVLRDVAREIADTVLERKNLVISIAAGVRSGDLSRWLGDHAAIVRAMPNTPALVGAGASALYATEGVTSAMRAAAESILRAVGGAVWIDNEDLMDVVTALSGSGPAYFLLVIEALEAAAIEQGLDPDTARLLTLETAYGAAKMALEDEEEPARLRERVTSPGGTTERAIQTLENAGMREHFAQALAQAVARSRELAQLLGKD
jgi:pyrroline-5-carboxylate reductase